MKTHLVSLGMLALIMRYALAFPLTNFTSLVLFGDSYTANNNPAADGGTIWAKFLQTSTGANLYDYAVSGSVCTRAIVNLNSIAENEMPIFLAAKANLTIPADETVYGLWIGTNDLGYRSFIADVQIPPSTLPDFVDCVYAQISTLYATGARYFVLMNLAPIDLAPMYALPENSGLGNNSYWTNKLAYNPSIAQVSEKMREYVVSVNDVMDYRTPFELKVHGTYPGATIALFDVHALMTDIWTNPSTYLVPAATGAAYNVTGYIHHCAGLTRLNCTDSVDPDSYLWYDELHPSEQTNRVLAEKFEEVVGGNSTWATYWSG